MIHLKNGRSSLAHSGVQDSGRCDVHVIRQRKNETKLKRKGPKGGKTRRFVLFLVPRNGPSPFVAVLARRVPGGGAARANAGTLEQQREFRAGADGRICRA